MNNKSICRDVPCDQSVAERPRYYARQLITADDLTLEQDYFRSKLRLHNRLLHGWGVVCGAEVSYVPKANSTDKEPWLVMVKRGYILGPYGDEIYIDCERKVDLRSGSTVGVTGEPCGEMVDPWCNEIYEPRDNGKLYVAVRYKQVATRPVRVQPIGCGCDDTSCENSRWRDGYEIRILTAWPDCGATPPDFDDLFKGPTPPCEPCPDEPWVVLAEVTVETDGKITNIDTCACRRLAVSFANIWWACTEEAGAHECVKVADYGDINFDPNEMAFLDKLVTELQAKPLLNGYVIGYGRDTAEAGARVERATNHLINTRGVEASRIVRLEALLGGPRTQLYVCEPGSTPQIATAGSAPSMEPTEPQVAEAESKDAGAIPTPTSPPASTETDSSSSAARKKPRRKGGGPEPV